MPESPEVQALAEFLGERMTGRAITAVDVVEPRIVKTRQRPPAEVRGAPVASVTRRGKHLGILLGARWLVVSFGRNGWVRWHPPGAADAGDDPSAPAVPVVATFVLDDGARVDLVETGDFLAVGIWVVDALEDVPAIATLGPDPLAAEFTADDLARALGTRRKQVKALLQEQRSLAGIGNAYSDEILHRARIAPTVHAVALGAEERDRLFRATTTVLRDAVEQRRGLAPTQLKPAKVAAMAVHGRGGQACPVCGDTIVDHVFSGASAQLCPTCQASP